MYFQRQDGRKKNQNQAGSCSETDGAAQNLRMHRGEFQFQLLRMRTRKYNKVV